jgi:hypothetical protein
MILSVYDVICKDSRNSLFRLQGIAAIMTSSLTKRKLQTKEAAREIRKTFNSALLLYCLYDCTYLDLDLETDNSRYKFRLFQHVIISTLNMALIDTDPKILPPRMDLRPTRSSIIWFPNNIFPNPYIMYIT